jgi:hypothetical protein
MIGFVQGRLIVGPRGNRDIVAHHGNEERIAGTGSSAFGTVCKYLRFKRWEDRFTEAACVSAPSAKPKSLDFAIGRLIVVLHRKRPKFGPDGSFRQIGGWRKKVETRGPTPALHRPYCDPQECCSNKYGADAR